MTHCYEVPVSVNWKRGHVNGHAKAVVLDIFSPEKPRLSLCDSSHSNSFGISVPVCMYTNAYTQREILIFLFCVY